MLVEPYRSLWDRSPPKVFFYYLLKLFFHFLTTNHTQIRENKKYRQNGKDKDVNIGAAEHCGLLLALISEYLNRNQKLSKWFINLVPYR